VTGAAWPGTLTAPPAGTAPGHRLPAAGNDMASRWSHKPYDPSPQRRILTIFKGFCA
jgi:hypothetical protein